VNGYNKRLELGISSVKNKGDFPSFVAIPEFIDIRDGVFEMRGMDLHGENIVDLDGDGIVDLYISSGGGGNKDEADMDDKIIENKSNMLLFGKMMYNERTGKEEVYFKGGRDRATLSNVHMWAGRGRVNYMLDVNGDGLLDIFCFQDRPASNDVVPGVLLVNQGDRQWKEDNSMEEYTRSMLLTDADGDGVAQEIVLSRGFCFPQRDGPDKDPNNPEYGPFSSEVKKFCSTRPVGSIAVFKYSSKNNKMIEISTKYQNVSSKPNLQHGCCPHGSESTANDCHAKSMASADFDGDKIADHVILYSSKMVFYFSKDRPNGTLPTTNQYIGHEIVFPSFCGIAEGVRVVDLDNDGVEEILVMCRYAPTYLLYSMGKNHRSWTLDNGCNTNGGLGPIGDRKRITYTNSEFSSLCASGANGDKSKKKLCADVKKGKIPRTLFSGICLVDLNNDGYLDVVTTYDYGLTRFFESVPKTNNKFIAFKLVGDKISVNEYGIGATVILVSKMKNDFVSQFREISSYQHTSDKYGCKEDRIIFGLGQDLVPTRLDVTWPNGVKQQVSLKDWQFQKYLKPIQILYDNSAA
jgi:hypothetical protein